MASASFRLGSSLSSIFRSHKKIDLANAGSSTIVPSVCHRFRCRPPRRCCCNSQSMTMFQSSKLGLARIRGNVSGLADNVHSLQSYWTSVSSCPISAKTDSLTAYTYRCNGAQVSYRKKHRFSKFLKNTTENLLSGWFAG